ncbi:hypothetical protein, partial [Escherichia coli]
KQKKLIMLPSETMIWQPEFTDKTLSRKPGAVQAVGRFAPFTDTVSVIGLVSALMNSIVVLRPV